MNLNQQTKPHGNKGKVRSAKTRELISLHNARKGKPAWNKGLTRKDYYGPSYIDPRLGKKLSPEHIKHLSESHMGQIGTKGMLGKHQSEKCKRLARERMLGNSFALGKHLGKDNPSWKGGFAATSRNRLQRIKFKDTMQKLIFERDNYTCQLCDVRGVALQVDHIQPWAEYVELRFSMDNCRTLCMKCHYKITFGRDMPEHIKTWGHNLRKVVS